MRSDPLIADDPIGLIFAADLSLQPDPPLVDAVWQLSLDPLKPLQVETNLGLKVRSLKLFPVFNIENRPTSQIGAFFSKPIIESWLPDYFSIQLRPQMGLSVRYEVWARTPSDLMGRVTLTNESEGLTEFGVQMAGELLPLDGDGGFVPTKYKYQTFLKGSSGPLEIALWLDKLAKPIISPMPGLSWNKAFVAGESASFLWRCSVLEATQKSFDKINLAFPDHWDALIAHRRSSVEAERLEVETTNPEFDLAIRSSQYLAMQLSLSEASFAKTRNPSLNAAGRSATLPNIAEIWQLVMMTLTTNPEYASRLLQKSVHDIHKANNGKGEAPFPVLARLVWKVFQHTQDRDLLTDLFESLLALNFSWFNPTNDADQDGFPEWASLEQARFLSNFGFSLLEAEKLPGDIRNAENLALGVLLRSELATLKKIANVIEKPEPAQIIEDHLSTLNAALESWAREHPELSWRDCITHQSSARQQLFQAPHQAARQLNLTLETPARLHLQIRPNPQTRRPSAIIIRGHDQHNQAIENHIQPNQITWLPGYFYAVSDQGFTTVESVTVQGLDFAELTLYTAALPVDDFTGLFADFFSLDNEPATDHVAEWLTLTTQTAFGIPECLNSTDATETGQVNLFWQSLLLEELIENGHKKIAYTLLERLLSADVKILKTEHALFSSFSAADAKPTGTRNSVACLIPTEQLLAIAGVKIYHTKKVSLGGENGFAHPVTFRFRGLEVTRDGKNGHVRMPDGTEFHHFGSITKTFQIE